MKGFDSARLDAVMNDLVRYVSGRPADLLPFEPIKAGLRLKHFVERGIKEVPLEKIVGSLGRVHEFNRAFLPREDKLRQRWREISELAEGSAGFPPVELFQVGDAYFVVDGHHRVSVARSMGAPAIEARVKEFLTPVPVGSGDTLEEVLLKSGLSDFLEATGLVPETADEYQVTTAQGYDQLLEHIRVHGYYRGIELDRAFAWHESVYSWRDLVYRPMIRIIRDTGILNAFPGRTETDLYLFTMSHLHDLRKRYGHERVSPEEAVREASKVTRTAGGIADRLRRWAHRLRGRARTLPFFPPLFL